MIHSSLTEKKLNEVRKVLATDDMVIILENQNTSLEQLSNVNGFTGCGCYRNY